MSSHDAHLTSLTSQEKTLSHEQKIDQLSDGLMRVMELEKRVQELEDWKASFLQNDQQKRSGLGE